MYIENTMSAVTTNASPPYISRCCLHDIDKQVQCNFSTSPKVCYTCMCKEEVGISKWKIEQWKMIIVYLTLWVLLSRSRGQVAGKHSQLQSRSCSVHIHAPAFAIADAGGGMLASKLPIRADSLISPTC